MKLLIIPGLLLSLGLIVLSWRPLSGLPVLLSRAQYEMLFPHRNPIYTYDALIAAAARFPGFAATGDLKTRKRELAAFLAEITHETSNTGPAGKSDDFAWGLYNTEERGCSDGHCKQYSTGGKTAYKPVPGKSYFGRGPLQISYAYNYGEAGHFLHLPLLEHPELVSSDGGVAFSTALWYWMRSAGYTPSCHDCMTGVWRPDEEDRELGRRPGYGMTIEIINGPVECRGSDPIAARLRRSRIACYRHMAAVLHVTTEKDCDCVVLNRRTVQN